jgi:hypothetical protein
MPLNGARSAFEAALFSALIGTPFQNFDRVIAIAASERRARRSNAVVAFRVALARDMASPLTRCGRKEASKPAPCPRAWHPSQSPVTTIHTPANNLRSKHPARRSPTGHHANNRELVSSGVLPTTLLLEFSAGPCASRQKTTGVKSFLTPTDAELAAANFLESGATRHISELPKKIIEIMSNHRTLVSSLFETLDADGDGECTVEEFVGILKSIGLAEAYTEADVVVLFKAIDSDNDGSITFTELDDMVHGVKRGKSIVAAEDPEERKKREAEARARKAEQDAQGEARRLAEAEQMAAAAAAEAEARAAAEAAARAAGEADAAARAKAQREAAKRKAAREEAVRLKAAKLAEEEAEAARKAAMAALVTIKPTEEEAPRRPPPAWNPYFRPRVERSSKRQALAFRAKADLRPGSVAFQTPAEIPDHQRAAHGLELLPKQSGTRFVGLATTTLNRSASASTLEHSRRPPPFMTNEQVREAERGFRALEGRPPSTSVVEQTHFAYGCKRNLLLVQRAAPNHYVFTPLSDHSCKPIPGGESLDAGAGGIFDSDTVATAMEKLQAAFPLAVPQKVQWRVGSTATRAVRHILLTGRQVPLRESEEIRREVLRGAYNNICGPRPEGNSHMVNASGWGWMQPTVSQRCMLRHQGMQVTRGSVGQLLKKSSSAATLLLTGGAMNASSTGEDNTSSTVGPPTPVPVGPAQLRRPYSAAERRAEGQNRSSNALHRPRSAPALRTKPFSLAPQWRAAPQAA